MFKTSKNKSSSLVLKPCKFFWETSEEVLIHYIHAFIWIPCAPLIILNHLYVSRVKISSFLYPLSIMTKRGRNCGFFFRLYMLRAKIHAFVRGRCASSCQEECLPSSSCTSVLWPFLHTLCLSLIYIYMMMYVFFTYLCICCLFSLFMHMLLIYYIQSIISISH